MRICIYIYIQTCSHAEPDEPEFPFEELSDDAVVVLFVVVVVVVLAVISECCSSVSCC